MNLGLEGKAAVVGASSEGLGFETARALAGEGVRVLLTGRDADKLEAARARIGDAALARTADLSTRAGAHALVQEATELLGAVDILVPNVGGPPPGTAKDVDGDALADSLDRCLLAMVELCNGFLPGMRARGWGRILAITSSGVRQPLAAMVHSNTARAGLTGYLKTLAREVIADGVTVNSILPGNILTNRLQSLIGGDMDAYAQTLVAGRAGRPEDFGRVAAFLCSEPANYLTGVALPVDGGANQALL